MFLNLIIDNCDYKVDQFCSMPLSEILNYWYSSTVLVVLNLYLFKGSLMMDSEMFNRDLTTSRFGTYILEMNLLWWLNLE